MWYMVERPGERVIRTLREYPFIIFSSGMTYVTITRDR